MSGPVDPYRPPGTRTLVRDEPIRFAFFAGVDYSLSPAQLRWGGWLAALAAVLYLPLGNWALFVELSTDQPLRWVLDLLSNLMLAVYIYVLLVLRRILNERSAFFAVDVYISVFVWSSLALAGAYAFQEYLGEPSGAVSLMLFLAYLPLGVVGVLYGIRLLDCADPLYGLLRPMAFFNVVAGAFLAVHVASALFVGNFGLWAVNQLCYEAAIILEALLFFRAAKELRSVRTAGAGKASRRQAL